MVVLRLVGDEWRWEDRIALAVPPQRTFTMCIPLLVSKLGVEKWSNYALYKTEGKPTAYCRPTIPVDMASNCQKERMRDGTVLWVRAATSVAQQERDRVFQQSLEEWRARNGLRGVSPDGSDVRRFIEELNTHLNLTDAANLEKEERNARDAIEGDEHRCFSFSLSAYCEKENLRQKEEVERQALEASCVAACKRCYHDFCLLLRRKQIDDLNTFEELGRQVQQEEEEECFVRLKTLAAERLQAFANRPDRRQVIDVVRPKVDLALCDMKTLLPVMREELQGLLEPVEQMLRNWFEFFWQEQENAVGTTQTLLAQLRQCVSFLLFDVFCGEMWSQNFFSLLRLPELAAALGEVKVDLAQQQRRLLTELQRECRDFGEKSPHVLQTVDLQVLLDAVDEAQVNIRRYLDLLQKGLSTTQPVVSHDVVDKGLQTCVELPATALENAKQQGKLEESKLSYGGDAPAKMSSMTKIHVCVEFRRRAAVAEIHVDVYNILLTFISQYAMFFSVCMQGSEEGLKSFLTDLLHQLGSLHAVVDELCWTCNLVSHPMRKYFIYVVGYYAPHLSPVVDLLLHLYAGREVELLLWIRPELKSQGDFVSCATDDGCRYYYHTATDLRQWLSPSTLVGD